MATILVTGGTGLIGKALSRALITKGHAVTILTRRVPTEKERGINYALWDVQAQTIDTAAVVAADYIIHLAGANVAEGRWTDKRKKEIVDSRVRSGELLVKTLQENEHKVKAIIAASAIGWYGADGQIPNPAPFVETDPASEDFLGTTCQLWEQSLQPAADLYKRLVWLRTGIVLSNDGGAYAEFKKPLKGGVASILGSGRQIVSWIHIDDMVRMYIDAIQNEGFNGVYNAVAPLPVSNKDLIMAIAKERDKFFVPIHVPSFALKLALGEMSIEVLKSTTVSSSKIEQAGFVFKFPDIQSAVQQLEERS